MPAPSSRELLRRYLERARAKAILFYWGSPLKKPQITRLKKIRPLKLNVGSGKAKLPGWVNVDLELNSDLVLDVRKGLPFDNNSVDFIYNEHFLEHLTFEEGLRVLKEFNRCLRVDGVLRIATPDLDFIVKKYNSDWKNQDWLSWPEYKFIKSKGRMINIALTWWEHKYLYNEEDLRNHLADAFFKKIAKCEWNESNHADLRGLETRRDSTLILEAEKG